MTQTAACRACGLGLREGARFCDGCGAAVAADPSLAEFKQVTILFADVVRSMDIAARVGPERLREIMTDLFARSGDIVGRSGGTLNSYTGDGIMALFGAPTALEDHAFRACVAALDLQRAAGQLGADVLRRDGVEFRLRVGINSGRVIAGDISPTSYTAIGDQVGYAQRMESVAPPGGVMLSEASARLVEGVVELGDPELVRIKGADDPVPARRLLAIAKRGHKDGRGGTLIGREREVARLMALLDESLRGAGRSACIVGPAGIGKSRLTEEIATLATDRDAEVFSTFCQSHTRDIPFHAISGLLRSVFDVDDVEPDIARERVRARLPDASAEDLTLLDDLLGTRDPADTLPALDPDARRRRLARLVDAAVTARKSPAVYVIEDVHWIDDVSESMLVEFVAAASATSAFVLLTYRPEYHGALSSIAGADVMDLSPLDGLDSSALTALLLGADPSTAGLAVQIAERADGNPFFAEEIVRDLAERGVLQGVPGSYECRRDIAEVTVPATVQATISARIDRLGARAKRTLKAAAVIGSRFNANLLADVQSDPALADLVQAELIAPLDSSGAEYAFRHPLIRSVAYESQLRSERAQVHRQLAAEIERREPARTEQNAALIATHLDTAGDLQAAYGWHMRAAAWLSERDIGAARASWQRARAVTDRLPAGDPDKIAMRTQPSAMLCATIWISGGSVDDAGFEDLREMCAASGDQVSLATGMAGMVMALSGHNRNDEATSLASELTALLEAIGIPMLTATLLSSATYARAQVGDMVEALRLAQRAIDLSDDDLVTAQLMLGSPLARATMMRGMARLCLGVEGWRTDGDEAIAIAARGDRRSFVSAIMYKYIVAVPVGALSVDEGALREAAEALRIAEQVGDDHALALARLIRGVVLVHHSDRYRAQGLDLLVQARGEAIAKGFTLNALAIVDPEIAREKARNGDLDGAIELAGAAIDDMFARGAMYFRGVTTTFLVEALLARGADGDLQKAQDAIDRLAEVPVDPGFVLHEIPLLRLRALMARAHGDDDACRELMDRFRAAAEAAGFEALVQIRSPAE